MNNKTDCSNTVQKEGQGTRLDSVTRIIQMDGNKEQCKLSFSISAWLNPTLFETSGV